MVDKPETSTKSDTAQVKEASTPIITAAAEGTAPETRPRTQAENTGNDRKYTAYVMWPFVAIWRLLRWLFLWANTHAGAITALATIFLAVLTYYYVTYSRKQMHIMAVQLKETQSFDALQISIARLINHTPEMQLGPLGIYHETKTRKIWARTWFVNVGVHDAIDPKVAVRFDLLPEQPTERQRNFSDSDFIPLKQGKFKLSPDPKVEKPIRAADVYLAEYPTLQISETRMFYIWGEIHYGDYTLTPNEPVKFCRYTTSKDAWSVKDFSEQGAGYSGGIGQTPWRNCEQ